MATTTAATPLPLAKRTRRIQYAPFVLILPAVLFMATFFAYPMIEAFRLAFLDANGAFTLRHFEQITRDVQFGPALRTTLILIVVLIPVQFAVALVMALLVQARLKGSSVFLYIYAIPLAVSELAAGIVWASIFTDRGYLNSLLVSLGILDRPFLFLSYQNQAWLIIAVVIAETWRATSIIMVILAAGLQSIPNEYLEAADVFGATMWRKVTGVILPLLRPSLQVALILRTILAFQVFAVALAVAGTGLTLLAAEAYRWYSSYRNPNGAAAYATLILVLSIASTIFFLYALRPRAGETV